MNGFVIKEDPVRILAVCAQALAVVRSHNNHRVVVQLARAQFRDELSHRRIRSGHCTVVGTTIRRLRIGQMHPEEERRLLACQPGVGAHDHLLAAALHCLVAGFALLRRMKPGVIHVEAAIKAGSQSVPGVERD